MDLRAFVIAIGVMAGLWYFFGSTAVASISAIPGLLCRLLRVGPKHPPHFRAPKHPQNGL